MSKLLSYFNYGKVKFILSVLATFFTSLIGGWDAIIEALVMLIVLDIFTGILKAFLNHDFSSSKMRRGFVTKIGYFIVIIIANKIDEIMPTSEPFLRTIAVWFYIFVDSSSIIENLALMGVPIPQAIIDRLAVLRDKGGKEAKALDQVKNKN